MNVFVPKVKFIHKQNYSLAAVRYGVTESRLLEFKESLRCFKSSHDFTFLIFKNTPACQRGFSFHERQFAAKKGSSHHVFAARPLLAKKILKKASGSRVLF